MVTFTSFTPQKSQCIKDDHPALVTYSRNSLTLSHSCLFKYKNAHMSKYIWNNKHERVKFSMFMKPKELRGASLPDLQFYYWSAPN